MPDYLATVFDNENKLKQIHLHIENASGEYESPIKCCTNAASMNFWKAKLQEFGVSRMTKIVQISGSKKLQGNWCNYQIH